MTDRAMPDAPSPGTATSVLRALFRPPRRRTTLITLVAAPILIAACWYFGSDVPHAVAVGASLTAVGLVWAAAPSGEDPPWPNDTGAVQPGRGDIAELSWWLRSRRGRVDDAALRRVRALARNRLAARHLDVADPNHRVPIERLIGSAAYATLRADWQRPPLLRSVVRCLDALESLDRRNL